MAKPAHKQDDPAKIPGQIVNKVQSGYKKMADGCCHRTVLERCSDCGVTPRQPMDMTQENK